MNFVFCFSEESISVWARMEQQWQMMLYVTFSTGSMQLWPPDIAPGFPEWPWIFLNKYCWWIASNQKNLTFIFYEAFSVKRLVLNFIDIFKNTCLKRFYSVFWTPIPLYLLTFKVSKLKFFITVKHRDLYVSSDVAISISQFKHITPQRISVSCHLTEQIDFSDKLCKNLEKR